MQTETKAQVTRKRGSDEEIENKKHRYQSKSSSENSIDEYIQNSNTKDTQINMAGTFSWSALALTSFNMD